MTDLLGKRIAALRKAKGLSQGQLAEQLNISPSAIGMYDRGRRAPGLDIIVIIAKTFGVSTDFLLSGEPTMHAATDASTYQELLNSCLLPIGCRICFEPYCKYHNQQ